MGTKISKKLHNLNSLRRAETIHKLERIKVICEQQIRTLRDEEAKEKRSNIVSI